MNNTFSRYINRPISNAWKGVGTAVFMDFDNGDWICNQASSWLAAKNDEELCHSESSDDIISDLCGNLIGAHLIKILVFSDDNDSTKVLMRFSNGVETKSRVDVSDPSSGIYFYEKATGSILVSISYDDEASPKYSPPGNDSPTH